MPYANEHAARLRDPGDFVRIVQIWEKAGEGLRALGGPLKSKPSGGAVEQAIRFKADKWTVERAKKWLADHKYKPISFEPAASVKSASAPRARVPRFGSVRSIEVRAIDEQRRYAEFVAATEGGVDTVGGVEYLDMDGVDLTRYLANPVILDAHRRDECDRVIGSAVVRIENRKLVVGATYAGTERAEKIWQLVREKHLRAMSIGFFPGQTLEVAPGETAQLGAETVTGPASIIREWGLFEISNVPVGADPDALMRAMLGGDLEPSMRSAVLSAFGLRAEEVTMADDKNQGAPQGQESAGQAAPAPAAGQTAKEEIQLRELEALRRDAMAICPRGLEALVDAELAREGATLKSVRAAVLAELAKRQVPAGAPDVDPVKQAADSRAAKGGKQLRLADVDDKVLLRSL